MNFFKLRQRDPQEEELSAIETWVVRWQSRSGRYSSDYKQEAQAFVTKEAAQAFASGLKDAFKLLRYTGHITKVSVEGQES
jgi:dTDP-4-amino-4,6-dideoxygalactose transaminase